MYPNVHCSTVIIARTWKQPRCPPCRLAGLPRPLHCRLLFWRSGLEGGAQTLGDGTGSSEGAEPARLELMSAGSRRNSAPGRNDPRHGAKAARSATAAVPQNSVRCRMSFLTHIRPRTQTHQRLSGEQGEGGSLPHPRGGST